MPNTTARHTARALAIAAVTACAAVIAACGGSGGSATQVTLAKTSENGLQLLLVDIADRQGFFKKRGVDVKVRALDGDAASIPALTSGSVQFAVSTSTPFFAARNKSDKLEIVSPLSAEPPEQVVMGTDVAKRLGLSADSPVKEKVRALKGLSVGVKDVGGGLEYTLDALLKSYGVSRNDVKVTAVSPYSALLSAMQRGSVDAAAPAVPYGSKAVEDGDAIPVADIWRGEAPTIHDVYFELLDVNTDYAAEHPKTVEKVKAALGDAMKFVRDNPAGSLQVAKGLLPNFSDAVLKQALSGGQQFPSSTDLTQKQFQTLADFARSSGIDPSHVAYGDALWQQPR